MTPEPLQCVLCGIEDRNVTERLIAWADLNEHAERYAFLPRCRDDIACRQRVREGGGEWPVRERVTV